MADSNSSTTAASLKVYDEFNDDRTFQVTRALTEKEGSVRPDVIVTTTLAPFEPGADAEKSK